MDTANQEELVEIRDTVRGLVDEWLAEGKFTPSCDSWLRHYDLNFTRAMADRGLIGISWPKEYGGGGRSGLARLVVTEELLHAGAPVAAHWIADRQIGPSILQHGSSVAKEKYLRGIASGEVTFCLGMSETEAGSDLASVRTTASRTDGGWSITGRKIWTSQAHRSSHAYVLARTSKGGSKHEGLTEFIVDMSDPGVEVRPIYDLRGEHHFNEVTFESVPVADDHVLGEVGGGWKQVTAQLSLERGGIERVLSTYPLLASALEAQEAAGNLGPAAEASTGDILARAATLRAMAFDVATAIDEGQAPIYEAAMLKDLGTLLERDVNEFARLLLDTEADPLADDATGLLAQGILAAPGFTIRGGTTEVLRTLVARGVSGVAGAGSRSTPRDDNELRDVVDEVLAGQGEEPRDTLPKMWGMIRDLGWTAVGISEENGGEGGDIRDVATIVEGLGRHSVSVPVAETILARRVLAAAGHHIDMSSDVLSIAVPGPSEAVELTVDGGRTLLNGAVARIAWGRAAGHIVVLACDKDGHDRAVVLPTDSAGMQWTPGQNLAGEPRDSLVLDDVQVPDTAILHGAPSSFEVVTEAALLRSAALTGALETAMAKTVEHVTTREQFGRPLIRFQAVASLLASLASEHQCAKVALIRAVTAAAGRQPDAWTRIATARVMAGRGATEGARIAHQLHAAMGVTREHPLHLTTRRLWSWRDEFGTQRSWATQLGSRLAKAGSDARWRWVTEQQATTPVGATDAANASPADKEQS